MTTEIRVPLFFHPTNVLIIDDDEAWLNSMSLQLDAERRYILSSDPVKAYEVLKQHVYDIEKITSDVAAFDFDTLRVDYSQFSKIIYDKHCADKVVTIIIDYNMPKLDGLSFCRKVREANLPVKCILLTGAAGLSKAILAFNDGIINAYIEKDDPDMIRKVKDHLDRLTMAQFLEMSQSFGFFFSKISAFSDSQFIHLFKDIVKKNKIKSFCVMNISGSVMLVDESGVYKILSVKCDEDFELVYEIASENEEPLAILDLLEARKAYPINYRDDAHLQVGKNIFTKWMTPMEKLPGADIYYAVVDVKQS